MGKVIAVKLGLTGPVLVGDSPFGDVYFDKGLTATNRKRVEAEALALYRQHPQVEAVFTHAQLKRTPLPRTTPDRWSVIERARASFDDQRSGDLVVLLKPRITPIVDTKGYVATHGSAWDYDRRVPILFWRKGFTPVASDAPIETIDIAPTLAAWIGLPIQAGAMDGTCLAEVSGISCPAR